MTIVSEAPYAKLPLISPLILSTLRFVGKLFKSIASLKYIVICWLKFTFRLASPILKLPKTGRSVSSGAGGILSGMQEINISGIMSKKSKLINLPFILTPLYIP